MCVIVCICMCVSVLLFIAHLLHVGCWQMCACERLLRCKQQILWRHAMQLSCYLMWVNLSRYDPLVRQSPVRRTAIRTTAGVTIHHDDSSENNKTALSRSVYMQFFHMCSFSWSQRCHTSFASISWKALIFFLIFTFRNLFIFVISFLHQCLKQAFFLVLRLCQFYRYCSTNVNAIEHFIGYLKTFRLLKCIECCTGLLWLTGEKV